MGALMLRMTNLFLMMVAFAFWAGDVAAKDAAKATFDGRFNSKCYGHTLGVSGEVCDVSFYRLLAFPEKYNNKYVRVTGFLVNVFGRTILFLDKSRFDADMQIEGIELKGKFDIEKDLLEKLDVGVFPVVVVGLFDATYEGPDVKRLGAISDIKSVSLVEKISEK